VTTPRAGKGFGGLPSKAPNPIWPGASTAGHTRRTPAARAAGSGKLDQAVVAQELEKLDGVALGALNPEQ